MLAFVTKVVASFVLALVGAFVFARQPRDFVLVFFVIFTAGFFGLILLMTPLWRDYFTAREQFQRDLAAHRAEQDAYLVAEARARQAPAAPPEDAPRASWLELGPDEKPGPTAG